MKANHPIANEELYKHGLELFNQGSFFEAHEVLEDVWRASAGAHKKFLQALIQISVGLHHHHTGNITGARSLLRKGREKLSEYPSHYGGIAVAGLRDSVFEWEQALRSGEPLPGTPQEKNRRRMSVKIEPS